MKVGDKVVNYICRDRSFENMRCENDAVLVSNNCWDIPISNRRCENRT